jgi:hypothetical protein
MQLGTIEKSDLRKRCTSELGELLFSMRLLQIEEPSRRLSLAVTNAEQAMLWLNDSLDQCGGAYAWACGDAESGG